MANLLTYQIEEDGDRNAIVKIVGVLDTSDIASVVIINPDDFSPTPAKFRIDKITYAVEDPLTVYLYWDAATPVIIDSLVGSHEQRYGHFGGLQNNATNPTGAIRIATEGWSGVDQFSLVIWLVKQGDSAYGDSLLLLQSGDFLLLQTGDELILE